MSKNLKLLCLSAMFVAVGFLLPFVTGNIPTVGRYLCPMHIPVFLCGLICGKKYGLAVGFLTPMLRSLIIHMPSLYPNALGMAFELAAYGFFVGLIYEHFKKKNVGGGSDDNNNRLVWGVARTVMLGLSGPETASFSFSYFITSGFLEALPGLLLQLIFIPAIMAGLRRAKLLN